MEPGAVERRFEARGTRGENDPGARVIELRLLERGRKPELVAIVGRAESDPLHPPWRAVGAQMTRLQDAIDTLHAGRGLDLRHEIHRPFRDAALALEVGNEPVHRMELRRAFDLRKENTVDALAQRGVQVRIAVLARG